jgi:hypothetical protein
VLTLAAVLLGVIVVLGIVGCIVYRYIYIGDCSQRNKHAGVVASHSEVVETVIDIDKAKANLCGDIECIKVDYQP